MRFLLFILIVLTVSSCSSSPIELSSAEKRQYEKVVYNFDDLYTKKNGEKFYHFHLSKDQRVPTEMTSIVYYNKMPGKISLCGLNEEKRNLYLLGGEKETNGIDHIIKNIDLDETKKEKYGRDKIMHKGIYFIENSGGRIARTKEGNQIYYQHFNKNLKPGSRYKADNVHTVSNLSLPLMKLQNGLFFPFIFDGNEIVTKPRENSTFKGVSLRLDSDQVAFSHFETKDGVKYLGKPDLWSNKDVGEFPVRGFRLGMELGNTDAQLNVNQFFSYMKKNDDGFIVVKKDLTISPDNSTYLSEADLLRDIKTGKFYFRSKDYKDSYDRSNYDYKYVRTIKYAKSSQLRFFDTEMQALAINDQSLKYKEMVKARSIKNAEAREKARLRNLKPAKEQNFIDMIHTYGLGASGGTISYDAEQYCAYKGPRCTFYRKQARSMQNASNAAAAAANRRRLNNLYNGGSSEETMIKNAKCRDAANRQNRHAGYIKYGCK